MERVSGARNGFSATRKLCSPEIAPRGPSGPLCRVEPFEAGKCVARFVLAILGAAEPRGRRRRCSMSNLSVRSEGVVQKIGGRIKKGIGRVLGNQRMIA